MSKARLCPNCQITESFSRKGRPGLCRLCIDNKYRKLGVEPLEKHISSTAQRRFRCITCARKDSASLTKIRSNDGPLCEQCLVREVYESRGFNVSRKEAAALIITDGWIARNEAGNVLNVDQLALRMTESWSLVAIECIQCANEEEWSAVHVLAGAGTGDHPCFRCQTEDTSRAHDETFADYGLIREQDGYARQTDRVDAHCKDCGAPRRISFSELIHGATPCLACDSGFDPDAVHLVYIMHFPKLRVFKIGITSTEVRYDRIATHKRYGGERHQVAEVPNREAARTVESHVLEEIVSDFRVESSKHDFPQGGSTETWYDDAPPIILEQIIDNLRFCGSPGFDRLEKLQEIFGRNPMTIEEIVRFRKIEQVDVNGTNVHIIGLSEPLEQVLRKTLAFRLKEDAIQGGQA